MKHLSDRIDLLVGEHATVLSERLQAHRAQLFPPNARKALRKFTSGEVAKLLGVKDAYLRKLHLEGRGPEPEIRTAGRRYSGASCGPGPFGGDLWSCAPGQVA